VRHRGNTHKKVQTVNRHGCRCCVSRVCSVTCIVAADFMLLLCLVCIELPQYGASATCQPSLPQHGCAATCADCQLEQGTLLDASHSAYFLSLVYTCIIQRLCWVSPST
jgi:hypothetical protein